MNKVTRGKRITYAYLAGLIDGEGSIFISKINNKKSGNVWFRLALTCSMTEREGIDLLIKTFTPHLKAYIYLGNRKNGHKSVYQYLTTGDTARDILKELLPYLLVKKEQARLGIEFQVWRKKFKNTGKPRTQEEIEQFNEYYLKMKALK